MIKKTLSVLLAAGMFTSSITAFAETGSVTLASYFTSSAASQDNGDGTYNNPVLDTDVADPDIVQIGDAYYMVSTAMQYSPGCPIMRSYDLVNWETVSYLYDTLSYDNDALAMRNGSQAYGWGQWATSIKYNEEKDRVYIALFSYTVGVTQVYTNSAEGLITGQGWKKSEFQCYHDLSIFLDDDGRIYVFYGQNEIKCKELIEDDEGYLSVKEEEDDPDNEGFTVLANPGRYSIPGTDKKVGDVEGYDDSLGWSGNNELGINPWTIAGEGTHVYKIDGRYYIMFITWPNSSDSELSVNNRRCVACFRSTEKDEDGNYKIDGEYEGMLLLSQNLQTLGYTGGEGIAQGGITNAIGGDAHSSDGTWYGIIYQDRGAVGRTPMLINIDWNKEGYEGWPMMEALETGAIPTDSPNWGGQLSLTQSDEFDNGTERNVYPATTKTSAEAGEEDTVSLNSVELMSNTVEMIYTGDMEAIGDDGIPYYWGAYNSATVAADTSEYHNGTASLKISQREDADSGALQYVTLEAGTTYNVSAWVKSDTAENYKYVLMNNYWQPIECAAISTEAGEWTEMSGTVAVPDDWGGGYIYIATDSTNDFYIDDVSMTLAENDDDDNTTSGSSSSLTVGDNLVEDGDMENEYTWIWQSYDNSTVSYSTDEYYSGAKSIKVTDRASASDGVLARIELRQGTYLTVSAWVKSDSADTYNFVCKNNWWQDCTMASTEIAAGEWTEITGTFVVPTDWDDGYIYINSENTNSDFYVDNVTIYRQRANGTEILTNGTFETGVTEPWGTRETASIAITEDASAGEYALAVTDRASTGSGASQDVTGKVTPGKTYSIYAKIKYEDGTDSKQFNITLQTSDPDDHWNTVQYDVMASVTATKGEWAEITGTFTVDSSRETGSQIIYIETPYNASPTSEDDLMNYIIDDVSVIEVDESSVDILKDGENDYNGSNLSKVWQWNHNPDNTCWSLTDRAGYLRLTTGKLVDNIQQARNTLTQRTYGPECSGWTSLDTANMKIGDYAGLSAFQAHYISIAVKRTMFGKEIVILDANNDPSDTNEMYNVEPVETKIADLNQDVVYFKTEYKFGGEQWNDYVYLYYSLDGVNWIEAYNANNLQYNLCHFTGYKFALFNYATKSVGGYVDFDYFRTDDSITFDNEDTADTIICGSIDVPSTVKGVTGEGFTATISLDEAEGATKIETAFAIPELTEIAGVDFTDNVTGIATYEIKDDKLYINIEGTNGGYTNNGDDRSVAVITYKLTHYVSEDETLTIAPDYVRIYGNASDGSEFDVNESSFRTSVVATYVDYGTIAKSIGNNNPLITHKYGADPKVLVYNDRVYVYMSSDAQEYDEDGNEIGNDYANIQTISVISSSDLVNWEDEGEIVCAGSDGAASFAEYSWAPTIAMKTIDGVDTFFLYFTDNTGGICVLRSTSPTGPFESPLDEPLIYWQEVEGADAPICNVGNVPWGMWIFDPDVLIDDDGQAYLYFGGGYRGEYWMLEEDYEDPHTGRVVKLGDDMISIALDDDGKIMDAVTIEAPCMMEDSCIHKYNGKYYYSYSTSWDCTTMPTVTLAYMVADDPMGPFEYGGILLPALGEIFATYTNNHHSVFEFNGEWYIAYHSGIVDTAYHTDDNFLGYRSTHIDKLTYNDDGSINTVTPTYEGVEQTENLIGEGRIEAETIAWQSGIDVIESGEAGNTYLSEIHSGDWTALSKVDLSNADTISATAKAYTDAIIEVYIDSMEEEPIAVLNVSASDNFTTVTSDFDASGVHDVFFKFVSESSAMLMDIDYWTFSSESGTWSMATDKNATSLTVNVENGTATYGTAIIYVAEYDNNDALVKLQAETVTLESGNSVEKTFSLTNAASTKTFLWNDVMKPLTEAITN